MEPSGDHSRAAICSIITRNRLAYARTLVESLTRHSPGQQAFVLVVDLPGDDAAPAVDGAEVLGLEALGLADLDSWLFRYTPFELCCALKPFVLQYLLTKRGFDHAIYLDSDILVLSSLEGMLSQRFETADILVTPHIDTAFPVDGCKPDDAHLMLSGVFNLGFVGVRNSDQGQAFLQWWSNKLESGCVVDHFNGVFVDQKYIDMAPGLFNGLHVVREPGANVAYWNLHSRTVRRDGGRWLANDQPLLFYHFSDFDPERPSVLSGHQNRFDLADLPDLQSLFDHYVDRLTANGISESRPWPYAHARYRNGRRIHPASRRAYLRLRYRYPDLDPFVSGDHPAALRLAAMGQWLRLWTHRLAHRLLKN